MSNTQAKKDNNSVAGLVGVSSVDGVSTVPIAVNPVNGRMLVDLAGNGNITIGTSTITSGTNTKILYDNNGVIGELTNNFLTSLAGAVLTTGNQSVAGIKTFSDATEASNATTGGTIVSGGLAVAKRVYATDMTVTNAIVGSITGNAATVSNATLTTALTVDTGTVQITGAAANTSHLTLGAGASSVSGSNTGDNANTTGTSGNIRLLGTSTGYVTFSTPNTSATNYTLALPDVNDTLVALAATQTLTNKRVTPRILSAATYTTNTGTSIDSDAQDMFIVTAQAGDLLFNNPSGTPTDGQKLIISVASSTTAARALTWGNAYGATTVALPTTTTATTATLTIGFIWSASKSLWQCVAVA